MSQLNYIGIGTKDPRTIVNGRTIRVTGPDLIEQSIRRILGEQYGTRFFNPSFGSRFDEMLFEQNNLVIVDLLRMFVFDSIRKWERRVQVLDVDIQQGMNSTEASARVRILASNEVRTFIFPVYKKLIY